ncbi:MAG: molybdopterin guanine dinucleotide-containing S/N-oxide reductase [Acidimicrobiales bacterium]
MSKESSSVRRVRTFTHWGAYDVVVSDDTITSVEPIEEDPDPSPIGQSLVDGISHRSRVRAPSVREGWLEHGPGPANGARGAGPFVEIGWDQALDLVAAEVGRVREQYGNASIFGGCYGWASAGRFHHAQSQVHRFLNLIGGYTASKNSYSTGTAQVIIPRVLGSRFLDILDKSTAWPVIAAHTELVVAFGGIALKNSQVNGGGIGKHVTSKWLHETHANGAKFVNISPIADDLAPSLEARWLAVRPNTDTALMLALAHVLVADNLFDRDFVDRYCVGFERFLPYLLGESDGVAKTPRWASEITGIGVDDIIELAQRMAGSRTLITVAWSLQRGDHGEQPYWMSTVLAAMLGQIGLPGGGIGYGYGAEAAVGNPVRRLGGPTISQFSNPIDSFIPVARIADLLNSPGESFDYDGQRLTYPDIRLIYWAGGNPFHHHQDLNNLVNAWQKPDTIIVNEPWWTATARHADIVLPITSALERNDIGRASNDDYLVPMHQAIKPLGEARSDFAVFTALACRLGVEAEFTEGRDEMGWLTHLYEEFRVQARGEQIELPDFDGFWAGDGIQLDRDDSDRVLLSDFRADPIGASLGTPSGKIEIFSETIDAFGYDDCGGHPKWIEPAERLGTNNTIHPLHLVSNQPEGRLHSQLDCGATSTRAKINNREAMRINPADAADRDIRSGDTVRLFNERGSCLAGARVDDKVMAGAVVLPTGAWYDPDTPGGIDRHGNPNVLTLDKGTSRLSQGSAAHTTMVQVERVVGTAPEPRPFEPPTLSTHRTPEQHDEQPG